MAHVDKAVAQGARHAIVDLPNHDRSRFSRRLCQANLDAKGAEAVLVWRRAVDHGYVWAQHVRVAQDAWDLAEEDGREVRPPIVDRVPHILADKERINAQMALHLGRHIICRADGQHLADLHVFKLRGAADQRGQQLRGHAAVPSHEEPVMRLYYLDRLIGGADLAAIRFFPVHAAPPAAPPPDPPAAGSSAGCTISPA